MTVGFIRLRSFRAQTVVIFGGLVIALAAALSAAFGVMLASQIHNDEGTGLQVVASNAARSLSLGLSQRSREVEVLARDEELWRKGLDTGSVRRAIERLQASRQHSAWIGVADSEGSVKSATGGLLEGVSVKARPWFQDGLRATHVGDVHDAKLLAKLLPRTAAGEPQRFVDFASPITLDGRVVGVVGMHGSWEWARATVESLVPREATQLQLDILIFDREGHPISVPAGMSTASFAQVKLTSAEFEPSAKRAGPAAIMKWPDGVDYLTATAPVVAQSAAADLGWTVVVREPTSIAFAAARRSVYLALLIGLTGSAAAVALAWYLSGIFSTPLVAIARAARDVERGARNARIPEYDNNQELARLSRALASMTGRLLASNEELESRVRARTAELEAANAALEQLARHDPLTGLYNRRAFDERVDVAVASAKRSGAPVSLLMVDADHFKSINDRFGHETGDDVLKMLATLLKDRLRETDCVGRMGGEEFAVLLPDTDDVGALQVANQLVARIGAKQVDKVGRVTVSVGVATTVWSEDARAALMRAADAALYIAKRTGRNRAQQSDSSQLELQAA